MALRAVVRLANKIKTDDHAAVTFLTRYDASGVALS